MTAADTHLGEPPRPLLRWTVARALLGGVAGYVGLVAVLAIASIWASSGEVAERLLLDSTAFDDVIGSTAQAVLGAALFTPPIILALEQGDHRPVAPELVFAAVLAGTLVAVFTDTRDDSWGLRGPVVAILAIHWGVYGEDRPRPARLPSRTVAVAVAILLLGAAAVGAWRVVAEPVALRGDGDAVGWSRLRARDVAPGSVVAGPTGVVRVELRHAGPGSVTIEDARSRSRRVAFTPVTEADAWSEPPGRPLHAFRPVTVGPGDDVSLTLATRAQCDAALHATVELVFAGGRTQRVPLSGDGLGTCAAP